MDSLVGYGSDDENENERFDNHLGAVSVSAGSARRRDDDTNYDDVNMDMSEDSQAESEPELPPAEPAPRHADAGRDSSDSREREGDRRDRRGRESPRRDKQRDRRDDRHRSDRERERGRDGRDSRRGLLGDRPEDRQAEAKVPALMDLKLAASPGPRDTASPRRDRGDRDRDRERRDRPRDRDRDNRGHGRRQEEKPGRNRTRSRSRSRPRGAAFPPPAAHAAHTTHATHAGHAAHASSSGEKRISPASGDYRPSSYKVNKKLEVMEKMGLQIKTPDGSMATAQQLRAAAGEPAGAPGGPLPPYYNPAQGSAARILDQVAKRKLLWSHKAKAQAAEAGAGAGAAAGAGAGAWKGTRFAQDSDGRQASKFMRLMGIKEPAAALKPDATNANGDPIKKQEELFQAMQAQYEVARATTHTMRGVGLGFQRGQF